MKFISAAKLNLKYHSLKFAYTKGYLIYINKLTIKRIFPVNQQLKKSRLHHGESPLIKLINSCECINKLDKAAVKLLSFEGCF